jgi:hypothetical protein
MPTIKIKATGEVVEAVKYETPVLYSVLTPTIQDRLVYYEDEIELIK